MWPDDYRPYGGTAADLAVAEAAVGSGGENVLTLAPGASFTVYDAATDGSQVTDLCDDSGAVISSVVADESARLPRFWVTDSVDEVWLDDGSGTRVQALHADLGTIPLDGGGSGGGEGTVTGVNNVGPDGTGMVSLQVADIPNLVSMLNDAETVDLDDIPAGAMITVDKSGSTWPSRPTSRSDVVVRWRGEAPGPTIDGTYARDGVDDWDEL
ncbi:MAG TPA: hypothetical protein VK059_03360 [Nocardioidaceae bacterium]|nr:hypothetical protein [Nocardioidaceae bacterium]